MNAELERMSKEAAMFLFKVISRYLPGGTDEKHEYPSQDSQSPGRDLNPESPEYEAGVLITRSQRLRNTDPLVFTKPFFLSCRLQKM
jgi:hypothetical protein